MTTMTEKVRNFAKEAGLEFIVNLGYTAGTFFAVPTGAKKLYERQKGDISYAKVAGGSLGKAAGVAAVILGVKAALEYGFYVPMYVALATNALSAGYEIRRLNEENDIIALKP